MPQYENYSAEQTEPLDPPHRQVQEQANHLVDQGKHGQAAPLFAKLAEVEDNVHPRRAANLHAQAAHAFADSRQGQAALLQARAALQLFLKLQMTDRAPFFYANITRKLKNKGMEDAANALTSEFGSRLAKLPASGDSAVQKHGLLPTTCPGCGAPVHGERARWVDSNTAECEYCGSMLRSE